MPFCNWPSAKTVVVSRTNLESYIFAVFSHVPNQMCLVRDRLGHLYYGIEGCVRVQSNGGQEQARSSQGQQEAARGASQESQTGEPAIGASKERPEASREPARSKGQPGAARSKQGQPGASPRASQEPAKSQPRAVRGSQEPAKTAGSKAREAMGPAREITYNYVYHKAARDQHGNPLREKLQRSFSQEATGPPQELSL